MTHRTKKYYLSSKGKSSSKPESKKSGFFRTLGSLVFGVGNLSIEEKTPKSRRRTTGGSRSTRDSAPRGRQRNRSTCPGSCEPAPADDARYSRSHADRADHSTTYIYSDGTRYYHPRDLTTMHTSWAPPSSSRPLMTYTYVERPQAEWTQSFSLDSSNSHRLCFVSYISGQRDVLAGWDEIKPDKGPPCGEKFIVVDKYYDDLSRHEWVAKVEEELSHGELRWSKAEREWAKEGLSKYWTKFGPGSSSRG